MNLIKSWLESLSAILPAEASASVFLERNAGHLLVAAVVLIAFLHSFTFFGPGRSAGNGRHAIGLVVSLAILWKPMTG